VLMASVILLPAPVLLIAVAATAWAGDAGPAPAPDAPATSAPAPMIELIGFGSSDETFKEYPRTLPRLKELGVRWVRMFPEWSSMQPRQGEWDWKDADGLVAACRKNNIRALGVLRYFAPWASAGTDSRTFPLKDMQFWRDYVKACVGRYKNDVGAWEVWNEPNSTAFNKGGSPKDYADLVREACKAAREVNPKAKVGVTCASFDLIYLDQVLGQGAAAFCDFVCVHPYPSAAMLYGNEPSFLGMAERLRGLIEKHKMPQTTEMWITEIGVGSGSGSAAEDARQAEGLAKTFILAAAQGFQKVFWFEMKGPHGLSVLNADYSPKPSGVAAGVLARTLGARRYAGWLNLEWQAYGFMFDGEGGPVLAAWAPPKTDVRLTFASAVTTVDMAGEETHVPAGATMALTTVPLLVKNPPADLVQTARGQVAKEFPWSAGYSKETEVWCRLAAANNTHGLKQIEWGDGGVTRAGLAGADEYRSTQKSANGSYMYFDVDNTFAAFGDNDLEITVTARCSPGNKGSLRICYESKSGYHETPGYWAIPGDDKWYENTFHIADANFAVTWGWNFRIDVGQSPADVWVKAVRVKRNAPKK